MTSFVSDLQQDPWYTVDIFSSVDDKWSCWKSLFVSVVDAHFPLRTVCLRKYSLKWMNGRILKLMRARKYYRSKFRRTKSLSDLSLKKELTGS